MKKIALAAFMALTLATNSSQAAAPKITPTEVMFAQMMIPHHQQAVTISELALKNSKTPSILKVARAIRSEQSPEIIQMKAWLKEAGASTSDSSGSSMGHMGHMGADGVLTEADLAKLAAARGSAFDQLFLIDMIAHHKGAIAMTAQIADSRYPAAIKLRQAIIKTQSAEIKEMSALLAKMKVATKK